jgi:glycosyltransferase involved in cell wall biosynthesis
MSTSRPLVSVIIPTHNRPECAVPSVRAVLAASREIEVVVSDTSPVDGISPAFPEPRDPRLTLLRPGTPLNVVDNFNLGLRHARGDYLVFIGDDDLVSPDIAAVAQWAKNADVDAISFSFPLLYYWPSFASTTRWVARGATLCIKEYNGRVQPLEPRRALRHALRNLGGGVFDMPRAYAGMISRSLVDRIEARHGPLFGGVSPDIYSAALISLEAQRAFRLDFPVVIPGACGSSTSGQSARGRHVGRLRDNAHIGAFKNLVWDARVPEFYSVPTVWGYSLLKAVEHQPELLREADFPRLYLKCLMMEPAYRDLIAACFWGQARDKGGAAAFWGAGLALAREAARVTGMLVRELGLGPHSAKVVIAEGIQDTEAALQALQQHRAASSVSLQLP